MFIYLRNMFSKHIRILSLLFLFVNKNSYSQKKSLANIQLSMCKSNNGALTDSVSFNALHRKYKSKYTSNIRLMCTSLYRSEKSVKQLYFVHLLQYKSITASIACLDFLPILLLVCQKPLLVIPDTSLLLCPSEPHTLLSVSTS